MERIRKSLWNIRGRGLLDRLALILVAPGLAIIVTFYVYFRVPEATNVATFTGAFFASWVAGLALTVAVTLAITLATLNRPHQEVFEARARNLLRRQTGPHIDYIVTRLHKLLEPYCDESVRQMTITEYDEVSKMFRVTQHTENSFKSYLSDIADTFPTAFIYRNGTPAPEGYEKCSLTWIKVDGVQIAEPQEFDTDIEKPFDIHIQQNMPCTIEHRMVYWVKEDIEPNRHIPNRYTRNLKVVVHNQLPLRSVVAVVHPVLKSDEIKRIVIGPGTSVTIVDLPGMEPGNAVYDFRLSSG